MLQFVGVCCSRALQKGQISCLKTELSTFSLHSSSSNISSLTLCLRMRDIIIPDSIQKSANLILCCLEAFTYLMCSLIFHLSWINLVFWFIQPNWNPPSCFYFVKNGTVCMCCKGELEMKVWKVNHEQSCSLMSDKTVLYFCDNFNRIALRFSHFFDRLAVSHFTSRSQVESNAAAFN